MLKIIPTVIFTIIIMLTASPTFAQTLDEGKTAAGKIELNPVLKDMELNGKRGDENISIFILTIINTALFFGLIGFFGYFVLGGIKWMMAAGDPKAISSAQQTITNALIGLLLLTIGYVMWVLIHSLIGAAYVSGSATST